MNILKIRGANGEFTDVPAIRGVGVPPGGTDGQFLQKNGTGNYAIRWGDSPGHSDDKIVRSFTSSGSGTAYTATIDEYTAYTKGDLFVMIPHVNGGSDSPTLNINGLGAKSIRRKLDSGYNATSGNVLNSNIYANRPSLLQYDGTYFIEVDRTQPYGGSDFAKEISVGKGGTGKTSWAANKIPYPSSTTAFTQMAFPTEASVLTQTSSGSPYWTALSGLGGGGSGYKKIGYTDDCDYVVSTSSGGLAAFRAAITAASNGDVIVVKAGRYSSPSASDKTLHINKNLTFIAEGSVRPDINLNIVVDDNSTYVFDDVYGMYVVNKEEYTGVFSSLHLNGTITTQSATHYSEYDQYDSSTGRVQLFDCVCDYGASGSIYATGCVFGGNCISNEHYCQTVSIYDSTIKTSENMQSGGGAIYYRCKIIFTLSALTAATLSAEDGVTLEDCEIYGNGFSLNITDGGSVPSYVTRCRFFDLGSICITSYNQITVDNCYQYYGTMIA